MKDRTQFRIILIWMDSKPVPGDLDQIQLTGFA